MPNKSNRRRTPRTEKAKQRPKPKQTPKISPVAGETTPKATSPKKPRRAAKSPVNTQRVNKAKAPGAGVSEQAALNRKRAFDLRCRRWTYRQIAAEIGVSLAAVCGYINDSLAELREATVKDTEHVRAFELDQLDEQERELIAIEATLRPLAHMKVEIIDADKEGQPIPADTVGIALAASDKLSKIAQRRVAIGERRAKLLGLDAPEKVEHSGHVGLDEAEARFAEAMA